MAESVELTLPADTAALAVVQSALEAFCEVHAVDPRPAYVLSLVVEELVANVVNHAYRGMRAGPVRIRVETDENAIIGEIGDDGPPFDPTAAAAPDVGAGLEDRPIGGLGVHIVRTLVDAIDYARDRGSNVVRFRIAR